MKSKMSNRWKALSSAGRAVTIFGFSAAILTAIGAASSQPKQTSLNFTKDQTQSQQRAAQPQIRTKEIIETKAVPYKTSTVQDPTLEQGTTVTQTQGVNGTETITYEVTYTNGRETSRVIKSDEVTTQPIDEIIAQGTKIPEANCPNGSYINSNGETVCSPYDSTDAPAGATAQCVDGTYSFSQHRSGTCSHHGGVSSWL